VWNLGKGKIFYFRPGHETYPVFKQDEVIQILANACSWLGAKPATKETSK
jgi:trehalose utilization protein